MRQSVPRLAQNAYELLSSMPRHGIGARLARKTWPEDSYWAITQSKVEQDGKSGKAVGVFTWKGQQEDRARALRGGSKKVWTVLQGEEDRQAAAQKLSWTSLAVAAMEGESRTAAAANAMPAEPPTEESEK